MAANARQRQALHLGDTQHADGDDDQRHHDLDQGEASFRMAPWCGERPHEQTVPKTVAPDFAVDKTPDTPIIRQRVYDEMVLGS